MDIQSLLIEIRDINLTRRAAVDLGMIEKLSITQRFNGVGVFEFTMPVGYGPAEMLAQPGWGIVVTYKNASIFSGSIISYTRSRSSKDLQGMYSFTGVDDNIHLADAQAWPDPLNPDVETQSSAYDTFVGDCESVLRYYVSRNIVDGVAPASRAISNLKLDSANLNRGVTTYGRARFDQLGSKIAQYADASNLGFTIVQEGSEKIFKVYSIRDKADTVRMDIDNDSLSRIEHSVAAPSSTRVIVAGQGQGEDRTLISVSDPLAEAAEEEWGRKIETFRDRRDTDELLELEQSGAEIIQKEGYTQRGFAVVPSDSLGMSFVDDWYTGDLISVVDGDQEYIYQIKESVILVNKDGIRSFASIGSADILNSEGKMAQNMSSVSQRISFLESNGGAGVPSTEDLEGRILTLQDQEWQNYAPHLNLIRNRDGISGLKQYGRVYQHNNEASGVTIAAWDSVQDPTGDDVTKGHRFFVSSDGTLGTRYTDNVLRLLPFASASGSIVLSGAANVTRNLTLTFPAGLFTSTPALVLTVQTSNPQNITGVSFSGISATSAVIYLRYTTSSDIRVYWQAQQMEP